MDFSSAFEKAFGRAPTRAELDKVQRVQHAFGVADNDALMTIAGFFVFHESSAQEHLQEGARLVQTVVREERRRCSPSAHASADALGKWLVAASVAGMWVISTALVSGLALTIGASMNRGHPCWVPESTSDRIGVSVLGAPTGWLVLLGAIVPGLSAGAWALARGIDGYNSTSQRWLGWAACVGIGVALLSLLALVMLRVPRG